MLEDGHFREFLEGRDPLLLLARFVVDLVNDRFDLEVFFA